MVNGTQSFRWQSFVFFRLFNLAQWPKNILHRQGLLQGLVNNDGKEVTYRFIFEGTFAFSFETIIAGEPSWYSVSV